MPKKHTFKATIINAGGGGAFVEIPFDVEATFGAKKAEGQSHDRGSSLSRHPDADGR